jgi:hypothetical protein
MVWKTHSGFAYILSRRYKDIIGVGATLRFSSVLHPHEADDGQYQLCTLKVFIEFLGAARWAGCGISFYTPAIMTWKGAPYSIVSNIDYFPQGLKQAKIEYDSQDLPTNVGKLQSDTDYYYRVIYEKATGKLSFWVPINHTGQGMEVIRYTEPNMLPICFSAQVETAIWWDKIPEGEDFSRITGKIWAFTVVIDKGDGTPDGTSSDIGVVEVEPRPQPHYLERTNNSWDIKRWI